MPRGRPPKHPELKRLAGNPGKRPIHDCSVEMQGAAFIPEHLSDDARGCMDMIFASLPPRTYSACDTFLLAAFATAWSIHKQACIALQRQPLVITGSKG